MTQAPSPHQAPRPHYADDEISLVELYLILCRRKIWIFGAVVACTLAGGLYAFIAPNEYRTTASLHLGTMPLTSVEAAPGPLEESYVTVERAQAMNALQFVDGARVEASVPSGRNAGPQDILTIRATGDSPEAVVELANTVAEELVNAHATLMDERLVTLTARAETLTERQAAAEMSREELTQSINTLRESNPVVAALLLQERGQVDRRIADLETERFTLESKLVPPHTRATKLLTHASVPSSPAQPNRSLIMALSVVLGLMGGLFLAFVVEFLHNARKATP